MRDYKFKNGIKIFTLKYPLIFCFCTLHFSLLSQQNISDSIFRKQSIDSLINIYSNQIKENCKIFSGTEYSYIYQRTWGFPFWKVDSATTGSIYFDDILYNNIPLIYDLLHQQIITPSLNQKSLIVLGNEKIKYFVIDNHSFYKLNIENDLQKNIVPRFYDKLYSGSISIWVKRNKEIKQSANAEDRLTNYTEVDEYYIQKNNVFYLIKTKADINKTLDDKKIDIDNILKKNQLKFAVNPESSLTKIAQDYDGLKN